MTSREWLAARRPPPPAPLVAALDAEVDTSVPFHPDRLMDAGRAQLQAATEATGRVRSSAFSLLLADALVTWACEAALDADDPEALLRTYLRTGDES